MYSTSVIWYGQTRLLCSSVILGNILTCVLGVQWLHSFQDHWGQVWAVTKRICYFQVENLEAAAFSKFFPLALDNVPGSGWLVWLCSRMRGTEPATDLLRTWRMSKKPMLQAMDSCLICYHSNNLVYILTNGNLARTVEDKRFYMYVCMWADKLACLVKGCCNSLSQT